MLPFQLFFFLNFTLFYFTILYWFCHTSTWIRHGCTWVPDPELPSHFPPHTIPLGHPRAPAPRILYPASNLDWRFISYMILYMFQCHYPKSSHPLPLPQSPKDCSIHLCLLFIKRTEAEAEAPIFWLLDAKNWLIGKDRDAGKDWRQEKGMTGWDGWMDPTRWTWVWVDSGSWWWTGRPGILQFMGSQRVRQYWATELNWT